MQKVAAQNGPLKFRESFEMFDTNRRWKVAKQAAGDLILLEGNTTAASYLDISVSPLNAGTETVVETIPTFNFPFRVGIGLHTSQRVLGSSFSVEAVDTGDLLPTVADIAISSVSQATTTLTVTTATKHNLRPGMSVGIYGCNDSRINYPELVVASIPTANQFTVTAGPGGTIPSLTIGPFTSGYVYLRSRLGGAQNGVNMMLEGTSATSASFYVRADSGDAFPSGTVTGDQRATIATTASVATVSAAYAYAWNPASLYELIGQVEGFTWMDKAVDTSSSSYTTRRRQDQILPSQNKDYKLRFRAATFKGQTVPIAQVTNAAKTGTTTATITTDVPHGLTTADLVCIYGQADQTNFAALTAATAVASIVDAYTFTVVWGSAVTASTKGGCVYRVNGGNLPSAIGAIAIANTNFVRTNNVVTLIGNGTWTGCTFGDIVQLVGVRKVSDGTSLGVDGAYRVANLNTTTLTLIPLTADIQGADIGAVAAGGAVIKRTSYRISFVRIMEFSRQLVEIYGALARNELVNAAPVQVLNTPSVTASGTVTSNAGTTPANGSGWYIKPDNQLVNDVASAAITTTTTTSAIIPIPSGGGAEFNVIVTAVSGTTPIMDVIVQESDDGGTNWYDIYHFERITANGAYRSPLITLNGNRVRYVQTIGGTSPSFTRSINRVTNVEVCPKILRRIFDRTANATQTSGTTATASVNVGGAQNFELVINSGAITTTAPAFQLQGSEDGTNWVNLGTALTAVASSTVKTVVNNECFAFVRAMCTTTGSGATLNYIAIRAFG